MDKGGIAALAVSITIFIFYIAGVKEQEQIRGAPTTEKLDENRGEEE